MDVFCSSRWFSLFVWGQPQEVGHEFQIAEVKSWSVKMCRWIYRQLNNKLCISLKQSLRSNLDQSTVHTSVSSPHILYNLPIPMNSTKKMKKDEQFRNIKLRNYHEMYSNGFGTLFVLETKKNF